MRCPACASENSDRVRSCAECGLPLAAPCEECGRRNPPNTPRCNKCGRDLNVARNSSAERRQITVFFADIADSTSLAERLDPEDLRDLYARYHSVCADVVRRYDGLLAQYLGDGILVYFGYPAAHEDDAARAIRAAIDLLDAADSMGPHSSRPRIRIGIHTGLVVVGDVGAGVRGEQLALGEAPNIAARLQSEAAPDTIVISDATRKLVAGQFDLENLGPRSLKGLSRPMQIFRVLACSETKSRFQAMKTALGLTSFIGREREVQQLRAAWAEAGSGRGRTLLLRGEAGMGKSRLLEATQQLAAGISHEVFAIQCSPYQMNSPLQPVIDMLERHIGVEAETTAIRKLDLIEQFAAERGGEAKESIAAVAELLSVTATDHYPALDMAPARRRQWLVEVLAGMLLESAAGLPVLLLVEDLHWADPSTLDLLGEMIARQTNLPALIICTARPEFPPQWQTQPNYAEIRVDSLSPDDTRALVAVVAGLKPLPLAVREEIVARTGGVPLFVEAVTRSVMESGILREVDDCYELIGPVPPGLVPPTVQDSLMARIDRLGPDRAVAQLAATIGRESTFELLEAVLCQPKEELARALRHLVDLELVSETGTPPASTYRFRHALIQDAAYESLLRRTRQQFHGRIAEVLTTRFPDLAETRPELLARHYERAGRTADAIAGWVKAGLQARDDMALRECVAYLQRAVCLLETLAEDDPSSLQVEMDVQLALGQALTATFGWASRELETAFLRARDLCKTLGNSQGLLHVSIALSGMYFMRGFLDRALEIAESVVEMAAGTGDPALEIAAMHVISYPTYYAGHFCRALKYGERAIALYTPERELSITAAFHIPSTFFCSTLASWCLWHLGYPDRADEIRREAWARIEALDIPSCSAFALGLTLQLLYLRRDYAALAAAADQVHKFATDGGYLYWIGQSRVFRGWAWAMTGDVEAGITEMKAGVESERLTGTCIVMPQWELMIAEAELRAGRAGEALSTTARGLEFMQRNGEHAEESELYRVKGEIHYVEEDEQAGEASLRRAIEIARSQEAKMLELRAVVALARRMLGQGRTEEGQALLRPIYEWFQEGFDTAELSDARELLSASVRSMHA